MDTNTTVDKLRKNAYDKRTEFKEMQKNLNEGRQAHLGKRILKNDKGVDLAERLKQEEKILDNLKKK